MQKEVAAWIRWVRDPGHMFWGRQCWSYWGQSCDVTQRVWWPRLWSGPLIFSRQLVLWKAFLTPILVPFSAEKRFFLFLLSSVVWRTYLSMRFLGPSMSVRLWLLNCQGDPLRWLGWIKGLKVDRCRKRQSEERRSSPKFSGSCCLESWDCNILRPQRVP